MFRLGFWIHSRAVNLMCLFNIITNKTNKFNFFYSIFSNAHRMNNELFKQGTFNKNNKYNILLTNNPN